MGLVYKTKYKTSIEDMKTMVSYNPDTGEFIRIKGLKRDLGKPAGGFADGNNQGYLRIRIKGEMIKAHRLAFAYMTGSFPDTDIDHINGDIQDNRWCNLRAVDRITNGKNQKLYKNNESGYSGVVWQDQSKTWRVQTGSGKYRKYYGSFTCKLDAIATRMKVERELDYHENHGRIIP